MTYKQITLELDGGWVLTHRGDDVLPVNAFVELCAEAFDGKIEVDNMTLTGCKITVKCSDVSDKSIYETVMEILAVRLDIPNINEIAEIAVCDVNDKNNESIETKAVADNKEETANKEAKKEKPPAPESDVSKRIRSYSAGADKVEEPPLDERIDALIGADQFKVLVNEIKTIAPYIVKRGTYETFVSQSYLFSINDGCGLSTDLGLLAELVEKNGLFKFRGNQRVIEDKLSIESNRGDPFESVMSHLQGYGKSDGAILSIDICEWMTKLTDKRFRDFLCELENYSGKNIYVFRIPFVEKEVLDGITAALQDVLCVRSVSFPPMDMLELTECARRYANKLGFIVQPDAWEVFKCRIMEEKSDGRFYGINTVNKVVREMVYRKQLSDARSNRDDTEIAKGDILSLSAKYDSNVLDGMDALDRMVGMETIKGRIQEIVSQIELSRKNTRLGYPCIHMRFVGSPGTGKTTVARIVGRILKEHGVLRNGSFFEYSGRDFCGRYVGETAPKTAAMCRDAYGSVLFIDEAYSLYRSSDNERDYGIEALDTLIAEMENHRSDLVVIMSGYTDEMEMLMRGNRGLESRMPYIIEFPNYTREQLCEIFFKMAESGFDYDNDLRPTVTEYFAAISDDALAAKDVSNARFVRNLFERTCAKAGMRSQLDNSDSLVLTSEDFRLASADRAFQSLMKKKAKAIIGF